MTEEKDKERVLSYLETKIRLLELIRTDPDVKRRFEKLVVEEVLFHEHLSNLGEEKVELAEIGGIKIADLAEQKTKLKWPWWVDKLFSKVNSLLKSWILGQ